MKQTKNAALAFLLTLCVTLGLLHALTPTYGQTAGTGTLSATVEEYAAGIGGNDEQPGGVITINGGAVTATGSEGGAGIGGGDGQSGGTITVNSGTVTANGGGFAAGIGSGQRQDNSGGGNITINGGNVTANGGDYGAGIGGGANANGGTIAINGGAVTATGGDNGPGIGPGNGGSTSAVTIGDGVTTLKAGSGSSDAQDVTASAFTSSHTQKYAYIGFTVAVTGVTLDQSTLNLTAGGSTATLTATVAPDNATDKTVKWEAKTVTPGSVIVEPVTLTPSPSGFTLAGDNGVASVDNGKAVEGQPYSVTIGDYSATDYEYGATLTIGGSDATAPTISDGVLTIPAASVTGAIVLTVTRTTKHVTATLEGGLLTGSNDAIKGVDYTATISDYDAANYTYAVTLTMNGAPATAPTPDTTGKLTIKGTDITGNFTLSVTRTLENFTVTTTADYVTGWTLVTVAKASERTDNPVYNYDGNAMYYVNAYSAYAYLVSGAVTVADATAKVTLGTAAAGTIAAGYDVNQTTKVDYSDTLLTYRCYEVVHETPSDAMETYLRADVNGSKKVDTTDVSAIDENRTPESGS